MNLIELSKYLLDEEAAKEYLVQQGILKNFTECPYCGSISIGKIRRSMMKCYKCKREWHRRKDSILESKHVLYSTYLGLLKLLSYGFSVNKISQELGLEYKSVIDLTDTVKTYLIKSYFENNMAEAKQFFLFEFPGKDNIHVKIYSEENGRNLASLNISFGILRLKRTKTYDDSLSFIFKFNWISKFERRKIYNTDRFLSYFNERVAIYRGVSYEKFSEYFLESLIRYNLKDQDYFEIIVNSIKYTKTV